MLFSAQIPMAIVKYAFPRTLLTKGCQAEGLYTSLQFCYSAIYAVWSNEANLINWWAEARGITMTSRLSFAIERAESSCQKKNVVLILWRLNSSAPLSVMIMSLLFQNAHKIHNLPCISLSHLTIYPSTTTCATIASNILPFVVCSSVHRLRIRRYCVSMLK